MLPISLFFDPISLLKFFSLVMIVLLGGVDDDDSYEYKKPIYKTLEQGVEGVSVSNNSLKFIDFDLGYSFNFPINFIAKKCIENCVDTAIYQIEMPNTTGSLEAQHFAFSDCTSEPERLMGAIHYINVHDYKGEYVNGNQETTLTGKFLSEQQGMNRYTSMKFIESNPNCLRIWVNAINDPAVFEDLNKIRDSFEVKPSTVSGQMD